MYYREFTGTLLIALRAQEAEIDSSASLKQGSSRLFILYRCKKSLYLHFTILLNLQNDVSALVISET